MTKYFTCLVSWLLLWSGRAAAQPGSQNFDKTWILGEGITFSTTFNGIAAPVNRIVNAPNLIYFAIGNSGICDSLGEPLLTCDGFTLYDKNLQPIDNGQGMAPPRILNFEYGTSGYTQTSLILPFGNGKYRLVTPTVSDDTCFYDWEQYSPTGAPLDLLLYDEVDMNANNGAGRVTKRMVPLLQNVRLSKTQMMACRHADGKSWWLLKQALDTNLVYKFLFTEDKIYGPYTQGFSGDAGHFTLNDITGQSVFSQDGTKYATTVLGARRVFLADFDRCTGMLTHPRIYPIPPRVGGNPAFPDDVDSSSTGLAFSPDGEYLYVAGFTYIQQLAFEKTAPSQQWTYLAGEDTTWDQFQVYQSLHLAPDGKVYIGNQNGLGGQMSVINSPDNYGTAAGFCRKCLRFPSYYDPRDSMTRYISVGTPPCMPNYALGPTNPICYPLGVEPPVAKVEFSLYPNPARGRIEVRYSDAGGLRLYDMTGREVGNYVLPASGSSKSIALESLPAGIYQYKYFTKEEVVKTGKLVITQ